MNRKEVKSITGLLGGEAFLHDQATKSAFKQFAGNSQIIHLATHAELDDKDPLHSTFVFAPNQSNTEEYEKLFVYELFHTELNAELAVLSACNTGSGKIIKGEGIISLARGFANAGCPSVVMSLWPVSDGATESLMNSFYEGLIKNEKKRRRPENGQTKLSQTGRWNKGSSVLLGWVRFCKEIIRPLR